MTNALPPRENIAAEEVRWMRYEFKRIDELLWAAAVAAAVAVLQALVSFEPERITDWRLWAISLVAGSVRAAAGAALAALTHAA